MLCWLLALPLCSASCARHARGFQDLLQQRGYEKLTPPETQPVDVQVQFFLQSFDAVDQSHESVILTGFLRSWWEDPRLAQKASCETLAVPEGLLWTPELYIYNSMKASGQKNGAVTSVHGNGTVFHSVAFHGALKCAMQFHRMPYDSHGCFLQVGCFYQTTRLIQLRPRYGSSELYMNKTGLGLCGDQMFSPSWWIEGEREIMNPGIRAKKFWPDLGGDTDIVFLPFTFARRPGYLVRMVMVPSWLFLIVSYTGFFIEGIQAPARAALALIPVLIMRTLQGFVFSNLPQVATCVWLTDYLLGSMILCCYAALHLALVQWHLIQEKKAEANRDRLKKVKESAERLVEQASKEKKFVAQLLSAYEPTTITNVDGSISMVSYMRSKQAAARPRFNSRVSRSSAAKAGGEDTQPLLVEVESPRNPRPRIESGTEETDQYIADRVKRNTQDSPIELGQITEGDVAVIRYLLEIWEMEVPPDETNKRLATPEMLRRVMARFNIYMTRADAMAIMNMFLRDRGYETVEDERQVVIFFSAFLGLLLDFDGCYSAAVKPYRHYFWRPFSQAEPWSTRLDIFMQLFFPMAVVMHALIFFAIIPLYPENPELGLVADMHSVMQWQ